MKDPDFIQQQIQKGTEAKEKVNAELSVLTTKQLNWKPQDASWSIAQCLEHLIISDGLRINIIEKKIYTNFKSGRWEKFNPLKNFWGSVLITQTQEKVKKKIKALAFSGLGKMKWQMTFSPNLIDIMTKYFCS